jgi:hypothetical protein
MEPTSPEEKIQAVLFYNHMMIASNVLVFTNTEADKIPNEFNVDANDALLIEHGAHSQTHYQAYSQANDLVNIADATRTRQLKVSYDGVRVGNEALAGADIYWYVPVNSTMLKYDRDYLVDTLKFATDAGPLSLTLSGSANGTTYSFGEDVPAQTQLVGARIGTRTITEQDLTKKTIKLDRTLSNSSVNSEKYSIYGAIIKTEMSKNGYVYFYKEIKYTTEEKDAVDATGEIIYKADGTPAKETVITLDETDRYFAYQIKSYYEQSAQNNTILVEAHVHGKDGQEKITSGEITLTFSTFGTNGTKYTLVMVPAID